MLVKGKGVGNSSWKLFRHGAQERSGAFKSNGRRKLGFLILGIDSISS
jgi:hypothetical protein